MKGTGKFVLSIWAAAGLCILYVHMNISLFSASYAIHASSRDLTRKGEGYRYLKYEIEQLRAPTRLTQKMQEHQMVLDLPTQVEMIPVPAAPVVPETPSTPEEFRPLSQGLSDFFGRWVKVAQAKTDSKS
ncbi:MAG: hypothetical protein ACOY3K_02460 [Candidatus Omnitrophota bacterium]